MTKASNEDLAALLAKIHYSAFSGKESGRFRIARTMLAKLAGRQSIEQPTVEQIKLLLSEDHGLLLLDLHDEFAVLKRTIPTRYRKASSRIIENILGLTLGVDKNDEDDEADYM